MENKVLKLSGKYEVNNVNPRKEAHGEEKILAVDVKMTGFCPLSQLYAILGIENAQQAIGTIWSASEHGDVTLPNLATIKPHKDTKFENLLSRINGTKISEGEDENAD